MLLCQVEGDPAGAGDGEKNDSGGHETGAGPVRFGKAEQEKKDDSIE